MIKQFVEGHPETDHRPRFGRGGVVYSNPKYRAWVTRLTMELAHLHPQCTGQPVTVSLAFYSSAHKKQDIDNLAKAPLEAMTGVVYWDDAQVRRLIATKAAEAHVEGVVISVWRDDEFEEAVQEASISLLTEIGKVALRETGGARWAN